MDHIKIELDLIPTDDRLPDKQEWYWVLVEDQQYPMEAMLESCGSGVNKWVRFACGEKTAIVSKVTHWVEIPRMSNKESK